MNRHSSFFEEIVSRPNAYGAIRFITHTQPVLVFWITPECQLIDAHEAHHDNPPHGDRTILAHRTHKGHLRGRVAFIGDRLYMVFYGDDHQKRWTEKQIKQIAQALPVLCQTLVNRGVPSAAIVSSLVIDEWGREYQGLSQQRSCRSEET